MINVLEDLKGQLERSQKLNQSFDEGEARFRDGVESGLKTAIELLENSIDVLSSKEKNWIKADVPKDGSRIIRWHKILNIPLFVFYKEGMSSHKSCVWVTIDCSNSYPEESFLPNIYAFLIKKPDVI